MRPTRCPGEWHELRWLTDTIAMCVGGHEAVLWELADRRVRLESGRVARQLANLLAEAMDALKALEQAPEPLQASQRIEASPREVGRWAKREDGPRPWAGVSLERVPVDSRAYGELSRHQRACRRPVLSRKQWADVREAVLRWREMHGLRSKDLAKMAGVGRGVITELTTGPRYGRQPVPPVLRPFLVECVLAPADVA